MKPTRGFISSLNPPMVTAEVEKPKSKHYWRTGKKLGDSFDEIAYNKAMQDYELSQVPMDIENAHYFRFSKSLCLSNGSDNPFEPKWISLELNQPVQIVRTENGCKITKIN